MRRRTNAGGMPFVQTSVRVQGDDQIDVFEALCHLHGRKAHELASDIVSAHTGDHRDDEGVAEAVRLRREHRQANEQLARRPQRLRLVR